MRSARLILFVPLYCLIGCTGETSTIPVQEPQSTAEWQTIGNPDYANWSQFKIGTMVKRQNVTTQGTNSTTSIETFRLVEITSEQVVVERQNTTWRSHEPDLKTINPPMQFKFGKTISVHPTMKPEELIKPSAKASETGKAKLPVCGKEYDCVIWSWKNSTEAGEMPIRAWYSNQIPGRIAKQEMSVAAIGQTTLETVIEIQRP